MIMFDVFVCYIECVNRRKNERKVQNHASCLITFKKENKIPQSIDHDKLILITNYCLFETIKSILKMGDNNKNIRLGMYSMQ